MALNCLRRCQREIVNYDKDIDDEKEADNENDNLLALPYYKLNLWAVNYTHCLRPGQVDLSVS